VKWLGALLLVAAAAAFAGCSSRAADERHARAQLVTRLETAVLTLARRQAAAGAFKGPVLRSRCDVRRGTNPADLTSPGGRYRCIAITFETKFNYVGQEYLATVDWRRGRFTVYRYKIPLFYGV
jgi:hypothetical protein